MIKCISLTFLTFLAISLGVSIVKEVQDPQSSSSYKPRSTSPITVSYPEHSPTTDAFREAYPELTKDHTAGQLTLILGNHKVKGFRDRHSDLTKGKSDARVIEMMYVKDKLFWTNYRWLKGKYNSDHPNIEPVIIQPSRTDDLQAIRSWGRMVEYQNDEGNRSPYNYAISRYKNYFDIYRQEQLKENLQPKLPSYVPGLSSTRVQHTSILNDILKSNPDDVARMSYYNDVREIKKLMQEQQEQARRDAIYSRNSSNDFFPKRYQVYDTYPGTSFKDYRKGSKATITEYGDGTITIQRNYEGTVFPDITSTETVITPE